MDPVLASRVPARRGVAPPIVAAGIAVGIAFGFVAGRFTAPRSGEPAPAPIAMTPAPSLSPTAVVARSIATPVAATAATSAATPVNVALATPSAPRATPRASVTAAPVPATSAALADALALSAAGKTDQAIAALEAIVKKDPSNADAHWALASAFRAKRKGPQGCQEFRAYAKHAPSGAHVADAKRHLSVCSAVTLLDQEKLDEAHAAFGEIVRKSKTFPDGHYWLGTMQALRSENAAACASFLTYLNLDSGGPYADRATAQLGALGC